MSAENLLYQERIIELEKKLLQCTEALDQCRKESDDFIHIASHDLQAPLRKLATFVERLSHKSRHVLGDESLTYIERIETTVAGMRAMIDSLSSLSDITGNASEFIMCSLDKLVNEVITEMELREKNIRFAIPALPMIQGDPVLLKQLFANLLGNAVKFKNDKVNTEIIITAEQAGVEEKAILNLPVEKLYYKIEVADNGIGFRQEYADKIFKPFQRLHGKATYPGNGLGLSICKKIIEKHQGMIYANANENTGARFVLILPEMQTS